MCDRYPATKCYCSDFEPFYVNKHCQPKYHSISICKTRKPLEEPLSVDCYDQQIYYLADFIKSCQNGFYVNDLLHVAKVLEILADRLETTDLYKSYFKQLICISFLPPQLQDCIDELNGVWNISEYLSTLGVLVIWIPQEKIKLRIYRAIFQLLTKKASGPTSASLKLRLQAAESSYLPEIMTQLMELVKEDEYLDVLHISLVLSQISACTCRKMLEANALNYLLFRLLPSKSDIGPKLLENLVQSRGFMDTLNITCQILINLLKSIKGLDEKILQNFTPSNDSLWAIRYVFRGVLLGKDCKLARNNIMEIILLSLDIFPCLEFMKCNLADDLALLSVATELDVSKTWIKDIEFTSNENDVTFKKMLVLSLCFIEKYPTLHLIYEDRNVIGGLLKIISFNYETNWHKEDFAMLIKYVLVALHFVAPRLIHNFTDNGGCLSLLVIIESFLMFPNESNYDSLEGSLKTLRKMVSLENQKIIDCTRHHCGIAVITMLCEYLLEKDRLSSFDQEMLSYSFDILSYLCGDKFLANDMSIDLLTRYLNRVLKPNIKDTRANPRTVISCIDFLWNIVYFDREKQKMFVKKGGVYLLLDIIEISSLSVQVLGLGCLIDICEEEFSIPCLLTWRGGLDKKLILFSLLANIFRNESKKIGVRLNEKDIIMDIYTPLMGKVQYQEMLSTDKNAYTSMSLEDLYGSARPKIYALIQLLDTRYEEKVELTNEYYKISHISLSANDKIILHLAKNFFALKLAEAWNELMQDLENSNITPVQIDTQILSILIDKMQTWNESLRNDQENILQSDLQKEANKELKLYDFLKKCKLQQAIDALREMKFLARTTDYMFMIAHKLKQQKEIEKCHEIIGETAGLYRTYDKNTNITAITPMHYDLAYNTTKKET